MFCLFTYGTLMRKEYNHSHIQPAQYIKNVKLRGYKMYVYHNGYSLYFPLIVKTNNYKDKVLGELYVCPDFLKDKLDTLEGEGCMYDRRVITELSCRYKGKKIPCYSYIANSGYWDINDICTVVEYPKSKMPFNSSKTLCDLFPTDFDKIMNDKDDTIFYERIEQDDEIIK